MKQRIEIYDTTLRDGAQGEGISFSVEDKVKIALRLDEFGIDVIEGGWPGSNPKDIDFYERMRGETLTRAKLAAFGMVRRPHRTASEDPLLRDLLAADTPVVTIVGKSWDFQVREAIRTELDENLRMIADTIAFLKAEGRIVYFDAEHFFDGYNENPAYSLACLKAAADAGVDVNVLCDTNGGTLPMDIQRITGAVLAELPNIRAGIHTHNDSECGVANAIAGVQAGATQVQGTVNGYGERTGNANLISIIPALSVKLGYDLLYPDSLAQLCEVSGYVDEIGNVTQRTNLPYVGVSAFAHKAGLHVDGIRKHPKTYEHIDPVLIGNERRILVSELSGGSTMIEKAEEYGISLTKGSPEARKLLRTVADLENKGYSFDGAEASFELLLKKSTGAYTPLFKLKGYRVIVERRGEETQPITEATLKIEVGGVEQLTVAEGDGPVNALDAALRKALVGFYPDLSKISLTDFKVRVINQAEGTAARVRTIVESREHAAGPDGARRTWSTVGVSENVIEASWRALVESIEYGLMRGKTAG
ncbi:MAG: citramalate synthase [Capsulimonadaceae bacterium]|nr:citramalate synthase [Capsulimonadaceae bacterium]